MFDGAGSRNFANNFRTMPRWRASSSIGLAHGPAHMMLSGRFIDGYKNDQVGSNNARVASWTTIDLSLGYRWTALGASRPTEFTIGADNLFDRDPPALVRDDAAGNRLTGDLTAVDRPGYDPYSGADIRGRVLYVRVRQSF